jgi:pimeloyl-ACP methyl ester carboxylesterase
MQICLRRLCTDRRQAPRPQPTRTSDIEGSSIDFRLIGPAGGVPLLLLSRFRGTMDDWDPILIERIAAERTVLMFDQPGFSHSGGTAPDSPSSLLATARLARTQSGFRT